MFGQRILILVPHPDDEVVACAAAIGRAREMGAEVFALYLSHGCIAKDEMWWWQRHKYSLIVARRQAEASLVAGMLGITPVGWADRPARYLWQQLGAVHDEIAFAITKHHIDQLWIPAYEGGNPDHDGLNALGQGFKNKVSVLEFAEYNYFSGNANSNIFPHSNGSECVLILSDLEREKKRLLLAAYASEKSNLNYVGIDRECYRRLADYNYQQPPHSGKLWYARFQWVPFHHPRVDFTDPVDVSKAIMKFLG